MIATTDMTFIYGLADPRTSAVRYVGKANNPYERRRRHMNTDEANGGKNKWLADLKAAGIAPRVVILEAVERTEWQEKERHWIAACREKHPGLLNISSGGNGLHEHRADVIAHMKTMRAKQVITPEARAKMAAAKRGKSHPGRPMTPELRAKLSAALKGRPHGPFSPETRAKISAAKKGKPIPEHVRRAAIAALKGKPAWNRGLRRGVDYGCTDKNANQGGLFHEA